MGLLKSVKWRYLISGTAAGFGLLLFLFQTRPLELPLPLLLIPFGLYFIWVRNGLIGLWMTAFDKEAVSRKLKFSVNGVTALSLLLISMQSLGQLSPRDVLLAVALSALLLLYFVKSDLI